MFLADWRLIDTRCVDFSNKIVLLFFLLSDEMADFLERNKIGCLFKGIQRIDLLLRYTQQHPRSWPRSECRYADNPSLDFRPYIHVALGLFLLQSTDFDLLRQY